MDTVISLINSDLAIQIAIGVFVLSWIIQVVFQLYFIRIVALFKRDDVKTSTPVSVILCVRNEADAVAKNLPSFLNMNYPKYQVVVVDKDSSDGTPAILNQLKDTYPQLYTTALTFDANKMGEAYNDKLALTVGIKAAEYENVIFAGVHYKPTSKNWLQNIMSGFGDDKEIVVGHVTYKHGKGLINPYIRFDLFWQSLLSFGFILREKPVISNNNNVACKKSLTLNNNNFRKTLSMNSVTGLSVSACVTNNNTGIQINGESHTEYEKNPSVAEWLKLRKTYLHTLSPYDSTATKWLFFNSASKFLLLLLIFYSFYFGIYFEYALGLLVFRMLLHCNVTIKAAKQMGEKITIFAIVLFDIFSLPFNLLLKLVGK